MIIFRFVFRKKELQWIIMFHKKDAMIIVWRKTKLFAIVAIAYGIWNEDESAKPEAKGAHPGAIEAHNGAIEAHPGSHESSLKPWRLNHGAMETHPRAMEAHHEAVKAMLAPW
jgi:hypothetical protein